MVSARRLFLRQNRVLPHALGGAGVNCLEDGELLRVQTLASRSSRDV